MSVAVDRDKCVDLPLQSFVGTYQIHLAVPPVGFAPPGSHGGAIAYIRTLRCKVVSDRSLTSANHVDAIHQIMYFYPRNELFQAHFRGALSRAPVNIMGCAGRMGMVR